MSAIAWPILSFSPGRAHFFDGDCALEFTGPIAAPERASLLEHSDAAFAAARTAEGSDRREDIAARLHWDPADRGLREFLTVVRERAAFAGGLRLATRAALSVPVEALRLGGEWSAAFPMVRLHTRDAELGFGEAPTGRSAGVVKIGEDGRGDGDARDETPESSRSTLVWFNPLGEAELPAARAEAEAVAEIFERSPGPLRFIARALSDHEWYELYDAHDSVFYFGHGETVAGHPAIATRNGRAPFFAPLSAGSGDGAVAPGQSFSDRLKCLVFAACLRGGEQLVFRNQTGAIVYPVCRLVDRPAEFLKDFARAFALERATIPAAMLAAARADAAHGDIRRFFFRLQGAGESASRRVAIDEC